MKFHKGLYVITPEGLIDDSKAIEKVKSAIEGGAKIVQFRQKAITNLKKSISFARDLKDICQELKTTLIINDNLELTEEIDADGIHLGKNDINYDYARGRLGGDKIIGVSCYNQPELAIKAEKSGANYIALGSFFPSITKPEALICNLSTLEETHKKINIPIVAIGGISNKNGLQLIRKGAHNLACISDIFYDTNIKDAAQRIASLFIK